MQFALQHNMEVCKKYVLIKSFKVLIYLFYVIKEKEALELEGVLVSGCESFVHAMRRLNRNRVQTNLIGQYTLKIN